MNCDIQPVHAGIRIFSLVSILLRVKTSGETSRSIWCVAKSLRMKCPLQHHNDTSAGIIRIPLHVLKMQLSYASLVATKSKHY
jgi:hypothetical protein